MKKASLLIACLVLTGILFASEAEVWAEDFLGAGSIQSGPTESQPPAPENIQVDTTQPPAEPVPVYVYCPSDTTTPYFCPPRR